MKKNRSGGLWSCPRYVPGSGLLGSCVRPDARGVLRDLLFDPGAADYLDGRYDTDGRHNRLRREQCKQRSEYILRYRSCHLSECLTKVAAASY